MFFTHPIYGKIEEYPGHQARFYLELLEAITGCRVSGVLPEIYITEAERLKASGIIEQVKRPVLGIFCSAAYGPANGMAPGKALQSLADSIFQEQADQSSFSAGVTDRSANNEIASSIGEGALKHRRERRTCLKV